MIYTSYFRNLSKVKNPISICGRCAEYYHGPEFKLLAPKYWFFKEYKDGKILWDDYVKYYKSEVLDLLDPVLIINKLSQFYDSTDFTLMCWESPKDHCHRHLISDWLINNGYKCEEANDK
jgi:uncharacterized protein YeaO (DUF488 family)